MQGHKKGPRPDADSRALPSTPPSLNGEGGSDTERESDAELLRLGIAPTFILLTSKQQQHRKKMTKNRKHKQQQRKGWHYDYGEEEEGGQNGQN
ncbi:hypothetical protein CRG98_025791 [Punica granatum]|uniref:Uncharacterized protein n=1 Tax=Punica granatum TaxID=22663 RepID=A0A2I0JC30_PUNGR|nr:hypothetical protein CRG98_025791 [Punica granatum]